MLHCSYQVLKEEHVRKNLKNGCVLYSHLLKYLEKTNDEHKALDVAF